MLYQPLLILNPDIGFILRTLDFSLLRVHSLFVSFRITTVLESLRCFIERAIGVFTLFHSLLKVAKEALIANDLHFVQDFNHSCSLFSCMYASGVGTGKLSVPCAGKITTRVSFSRLSSAEELINSSLSRNDVQIHRLAQSTVEAALQVPQVVALSTRSKLVPCSSPW